MRGSRNKFSTRQRRMRTSRLKTGIGIEDPQRELADHSRQKETAFSRFNQRSLATMEKE
jgi:hypothetical protein